MKNLTTRLGGGIRVVVCIVALLLPGILGGPIALVGQESAPEVPPRSIALPESEVKDVFFAYFVGVLLEDATLDLDGEILVSMFPEFEDGEAQVPFREIERVVRRPGADGARVTVTFTNPLEFPVPVDILGYHPGTVLSTSTVVFEERAYIPDAPGFGTVVLEWLVNGTFGIDFVNWLDVLLGRLVDDVNARVVAAVEYENRWYVILAGDTPNGGWITGIYDLRTSRIIVRPPRALKRLGAELSAVDWRDSPE